ncbi:hypothetical protein FKM82_019869 [Ascaphus truei]
MTQLLKALQDPQLVAQFQRSCGLTLQPQGEANGGSPRDVPFQSVQGSRGKTPGGMGVPHQNGNKSYTNGSYANGTHRQVTMGFN